MDEKIVFLDFDNTVVNSRETAFKRANKRHGLNLKYDDMNLPYDLKQALGEELSSLVDAEYYMEDFYDDTVFYPEVVKALEMFKKDGYKPMMWTLSIFDIADPLKKRKINELPKGLIHGYLSFATEKAAVSEGIYIDDCLGNLLKVGSDENYIRYLINQPWNRQISPRGIRNANNVYEVYKHLSKKLHLIGEVI